MAKTVDVFGTPVDFPDDASQEQIEGYLNSSAFLEVLSKANPEAYSSIQKDQQQQFVKSEGMAAPAAGARPWEFSGSIDGKKQGSQRDVMGITSQADRQRQDEDTARAADFVTNDIPNVVKSAPALFKSGMQKSIGGIARFAAEDTSGGEGSVYGEDAVREGFGILGDPQALKNWGADQAEVATASEKQTQAEYPVKTYAGQMTQNAVTSIGQQLPGVAAAAAGFPEIGLPLMGVQQFGQTYAESRARGIAPDEAATNALIQGATEVGTEMLPFMAIAKGMQGGISKAVLKEYFLGEQVGEHLATAIENASDVYFDEKNPEKRLDKAIDYWFSGKHGQDQIDTFWTTLIQSSLMAGGGKVIRKAHNKVTGSVDLTADQEAELERQHKEQAGATAYEKFFGQPAPVQPVAPAVGMQSQEPEVAQLVATPSVTPPVNPNAGTLEKAVSLANQDAWQGMPVEEQTAEDVPSLDASRVTAQILEQQPFTADVPSQNVSRNVPIMRDSAPVSLVANDSAPAAAAVAPLSPLDEAAHEAATSPLNDTPHPTQAQIEAGNYKKGHLDLHGLDISIENPAGSKRSGVDPDGKPWETQINHHYGYIKGTIGKDKDHLDVFIGAKPESQRVFIVDQVDPNTGIFDEHKIMIGFDTLDEARQGYLSNYDQTGANRIGGIANLSMDNFKEWLKSGKTKKPYFGMKFNRGADGYQAKEFAGNGGKAEGSSETVSANVLSGVDGQQGDTLPVLREGDVAPKVTEYEKLLRDADNLLAVKEINNFAQTDDSVTDEQARYLDRIALSLEDNFAQGGVDHVTLHKQKVQAALDAGEKVNSNGVYENRETLPIPYTKGVKRRDSIDIAETVDGRFVYGLDYARVGGDSEGGGFAPSIGSKRFDSREKAIQAAVDELKKKVKAADGNAIQELDSFVKGVGAPQPVKPAAKTAKVSKPNFIAISKQAKSMGLKLSEKQKDGSFFIGKKRFKSLAEVQEHLDNPPAKTVRSAPAPAKFDPAKHSILQAIAHLGGLNYDNAHAQWGNHIKDAFRDRMINQVVFGKPVIRKSGGLNVDRMGEALAEAGYLTLDAHGKHDVAELESRIMKAFAGDKVYSEQFIPSDLLDGLTDEQVMDGVKFVEDDIFDGELSGEVSAGILAEALDIFDQIIAENENERSDKAENQGVSGAVFKGRTSEDGQVREGVDSSETGSAQAGGTVAGKIAATENVIFTEDAYQKAKVRMKERLNRINMGLDPELMMDGLTIAGYHLERGAHSFLQYSREMISELGDGIRPYLKSFYNGARDLPGVPFADKMDSYQAVASYDINQMQVEDEAKILTSLPDADIEIVNDIVGEVVVDVVNELAGEYTAEAAAEVFDFFDQIIAERKNERTDQTKDSPETEGAVETAADQDTQGSQSNVAGESASEPVTGAASQVTTKPLNFLQLAKEVRERGNKIGRKLANGQFEILAGSEVIGTVNGVAGIKAWLEGGTQPDLQPVKFKPYKLADAGQELERIKLVKDLEFYRNKKGKTMNDKRYYAAEVAKAEKALKKLPPGMLSYDGAREIYLKEGALADNKLFNIWLEGLQMNVQSSDSLERLIDRSKEQGNVRYFSREYIENQWREHWPSEIKPGMSLEKRSRIEAKADGWKYSGWDGSGEKSISWYKLRDNIELNKGKFKAFVSGRKDDARTFDSFAEAAAFLEEPANYANAAYYRDGSNLLYHYDGKWWGVSGGKWRQKVRGSDGAAMVDFFAKEANKQLLPASSLFVEKFFNDLGQDSTVPAHPEIDEPAAIKEPVADKVLVEPVSASGEQQTKLFATPPAFGKKEQKGGTAVDTGSLLDSFTSELSVQPDLLDYMPKEHTFQPEVMPTLDDFDKIAAELTGKAEAQSPGGKAEAVKVDDPATELRKIYGNRIKHYEDKLDRAETNLDLDNAMNAYRDEFSDKNVIDYLVRYQDNRTFDLLADGYLKENKYPASYLEQILNEELTPRQIFDRYMNLPYAERKAMEARSGLSPQKHISAMDQGAAAHKLGKGRLAPASLTMQEKRDWFRGWDAANIAEPRQAKAESAKAHAKSAYAAGIDAIKAILDNATDPSKLSSGIGVDDKVYQQIKPHLTKMWFEAKAAGADAVTALRQFIQQVINDLGEKIIPYARTFYQEVLNGDIIEAGTEEGRDNHVNVERGSADLERNSQDAEAADKVGSRAVPAGSDGADGSLRQGSDSVGQGWSSADSDPLLPRLEALTPGTLGHPEVQGNQRQAGSAERSAGSEFDQRGVDYSVERTSADPVSAAAVDQAAARVHELKARIEAQHKAQAVKVIPGDLANVEQSLPLLLSGQTDDVVFAEKRFAKDDGYGVLFTNGTGTGKTFSGLGVIKRMERQGKSNILIVTPQSNVLNAWVKSGKHFLLNINPLKDTSDAGSGIVVTTYANFGTNSELVKRKWDLIVCDESHYLNSNASGEPTNAQGVLRALTLHPRGVWQRTEMLHADLFAKRSAADEALKKAKKEQKSKEVIDALTGKYNAASEAIIDARKVVEAEVAATQGTEQRSRVVFLSATPFAYDKNIEYAAGYLFDYGPESTGGGYNSGSAKDRFFMQHFGYRMRYNKLTQPEADVDQGLMQRQFNSWLKKEGSLSGRMLAVDKDYDRKFVLIESGIGRKIDEGLEFLRNNHDRFGALYDRITKRFDYLHRRYLLEAIKAKESIPIIRQHLALGRKVVVFHDYNQGGGMNPFDLHALTGHTEEVTVGKYPDQKNVPLGDVVRQFLNEPLGRELAALPFASYGSALTMLTKAFPDALLVNGKESKKDCLKAEELFQDHNSGRNIIIVQADKGKEGISLHDTVGDMPRVELNLGLPVKPTQAIQQEGRIYRTGQASNAMFRYMNTGTNWERWAFATTIARRASTAENLAMGEEARALLDAFIEAFQDSDTYAPGHEGEGTGGVERDRAANAALTEWDRAMTFYFGQQKKTSRNKAAEGLDYFPTPEPLALKMVEWADLLPGESVLEPSAGHGAIARFFPDNAKRRAIEPSLELTSRLGLIFDGDIVQQRFEDHNIVNKYDAIVMNPPFGTGAKLAFEHIEKAAQHLRDKGRIVALIPSGPSSDKRLEKFLYEGREVPAEPIMRHSELGEIRTGDTVKFYENLSANEQTSGVIVTQHQIGLTNNYEVKVKTADGVKMIHVSSINEIEHTGPKIKTIASDLSMVADIQLPTVTFERAGTKVNAHIIVLDKNRSDDGSSTRRRDYGSAETIKEFFERIKDAELPERQHNSQSYEAAPVSPEAVDSESGEVTADIGGAEKLLTISEFPHTKTGEMMYSAAIKEQLPAEQYAALNSLVKQNGGMWSRFSKSFLFKSSEGRQKFINAMNSQPESTFHSNPMLDPVVIVRELAGLAGNIKAAMPPLVRLGQRVIQEGATTYQKFVAGMREYLGGMWQAFKGAMLDVYGKAKSAYKASRLGDERGMVGVDIREPGKPQEIDSSTPEFINNYIDVVREALAKSGVVADFHAEDLYGNTKALMMRLNRNGRIIGYLSRVFYQDHLSLAKVDNVRDGVESMKVLPYLYPAEAKLARDYGLTLKSILIHDKTQNGMAFEHPEIRNIGGKTFEISYNKSKEFEGVNKSPLPVDHSIKNEIELYFDSPETWHDIYGEGDYAQLQARARDNREMAEWEERLAGREEGETAGVRGLVQEQSGQVRADAGGESGALSGDTRRKIEPTKYSILHNGQNLLVNRDAFNRLMAAINMTLPAGRVAVKVTDTIEHSDEAAFSAHGIESGNIAGMTQQVVSAAQVRAVITLAMKHATTETGYHEIFHAAKALGLITAKDQAILDKAIGDKGGVSADERQADNFARYSLKQISPIPVIRQVWDEILEYVKRVGNLLTGHGYRSANDVFEDLWSGKLKGQAADDAWVKQGDKLMVAFHGSPHLFDKFSTSEIGMGEGVQAYGYGLYFAGKKEVAEFYRKGLSQRQFIDLIRNTYDQYDNPSDAGMMLLANPDLSVAQHELLDALEADDWLGFDYPHQALQAAFKNPDNYEMSQVTKDALAKQGRLYQVELAPKEDEYLLWDKPVPEDVMRKVAEKMAETDNTGGLDAGEAFNEMEQVYDKSGQVLYHGMAETLGSDKAASEFLHSIGIRGIKYENGANRGSVDNIQNGVRETLDNYQFWVKKGDSEKAADWMRRHEEMRAKLEEAYNYVIFNDDDVNIVAKYSVVPPEEQADAVAELVNFVPDKLADAVAPIGYRVRKALEHVTSADFKEAVAWFFRNPFFQAEADPLKQPFYSAGSEREVSRMSVMLAMFGWEPGSVKERPTLQKVKDFLFSWQSGDKVLRWEQLKSEIAGLEPGQRRALDTLIVQGDVYGVDYSTLNRAKLNPRIRKAEPSEETFALYKRLRGYIDGHVEKVIVDSIEHFLRSAGMEEGDVRQHISDYRKHKASRVGWLTRDHGDGDISVRVHRTVKELRFETRSYQDDNGNVAGEQALLPLYPGKEVEVRLRALAREHGVSVVDTAPGGMIFTKKGSGEQLDDLGYAGALRQFMEEAGQIVPDLVRQTGSYPKVLAYAHYVGTQRAADKLKGQVEADYAKAMPHNFREGEEYTTTTAVTDKLSESMYADMRSDMAVEAALMKATADAFKRGELSKEDVDAYRQTLTRNTAEVLLGRAAGKYQIRRAPYLIEGYQSDSVTELYQDYMTSVAGQITKAGYAREQFELFQQAKPVVKQWAERYIKDSLRNMGRMDRISGNIRALASLWYMGFKVSTVMINLTQPLTIGFAELGRYTRWPMAKIVRAQRDIITGNLSAEDKRIFQTAIYQVQEMETAMGELSGHNDGYYEGASRALSAVTGKALALFQKGEVLNRKTMILAAYRVFRNKGMGEEESLQKAVQVNAAVNFDMGRHNLPGWARNPVGRTAYALQSFGWNSFNYIYNRATSGEKEQMIALMRYMGMLLILGGMGGWPLLDEFDKAFRKLRGYSFLFELKGWMKKEGKRFGSLGDALNGFIWHGLPSLVGVNASNSMRLQIPIASNMLNDNALVESAMGVSGGLWNKLAMGVTYAGRGQAYRAAEALAPEVLAGGMRAYRQMTDGVTTSHGKKVFHEGKPLKMTEGEAALRVLGFQPMRTSEASAEMETGRKLQSFWKQERDDALDEYRSTKRLKVVHDFNARLRQSQAVGLVDPISSETIRRAMASRPNKKKTQWESLH